MKKMGFMQSEVDASKKKSDDLEITRKKMEDALSCRISNQIDSINVQIFPKSVKQAYLLNQMSKEAKDLGQIVESASHEMKRLCIEIPNRIEQISQLRKELKNERENEFALKEQLHSLEEEVAVVESEHKDAGIEVLQKIESLELENGRQAFLSESLEKLMRILQRQDKFLEKFQKDVEMLEKYRYKTIRKCDDEMRELICQYREEENFALIHTLVESVRHKTDTAKVIFKEQKKLKENNLKMSKLELASQSDRSRNADNVNRETDSHVTFINNMDNRTNSAHRRQHLLEERLQRELCKQFDLTEQVQKAKKKFDMELNKEKKEKKIIEDARRKMDGIKCVFLETSRETKALLSTFSEELLSIQSFFDDYIHLQCELSKQDLSQYKSETKQMISFIQELNDQSRSLELKKLENSAEKHEKLIAQYEKLKQEHSDEIEARKKLLKDRITAKGKIVATPMPKQRRRQKSEFDDFLAE